MAFQSTKCILDPYVFFEQASELERAEIDVPDAIIDFLEADVFPGTGNGDVDPLGVPPNPPVRAHVSGLEPVGVFQWGQPVGHCPRGRCIDRRGGLQIQGFVRALGVELLPEVIELTLLRTTGRRRGASGFGLEGPVQPLMPTVLVGLPRFDEFGEDPEAHPPRGELRESGQRVGGEMHAVVGADPLRLAELFEQAGEHRFGLPDSRREQGLAAEQIAAVPIRDRQGVAVAAVAGFEVPLEVGRPDIIGRGDESRRFTGVPDPAAVALLGDQPVSAEELADGGASGPGPGGMALAEDGQQFLGAPGGMTLPGLKNGGNGVVRGLMRAGARFS